MVQSGFGNTRLYQERKAIIERFNAAVPALKKLHQDGFYKEAIQKCRDALKDSNHDLGRLPVTRDNGLSPIPEKELCVVHLVARFVMHFWKYERKNYPAKTVISELIEIEMIATSGLDACKVEGERYVGYHLVSPFGKPQKFGKAERKN